MRDQCSRKSFDRCRYRYDSLFVSFFFISLYCLFFSWCSDVYCMAFWEGYEGKIERKQFLSDRMRCESHSNGMVDFWRNWRQSSNPPKKLLIRISDTHSFGTNNSNAIFYRPLYSSIADNFCTNLFQTKATDLFIKKDDEIQSKVNWFGNILQKDTATTKTRQNREKNELWKISIWIQSFSKSFMASLILFSVLQWIYLSVSKILNSPSWHRH